MTRHHVIITGTGRAGTTFLIQLFTELGMDTGFPEIHSNVWLNCNAGMELDIRKNDAPYIVKSPWICDYLDELLLGGKITIDHAIVPVRDLFSAAESRRDVTSRTDPELFPADRIPGGLWHTSEPIDQESILTMQVYKLIYAIARHEIPTTFLFFPRLVNEPLYLYKHLNFLLAGISYDTYYKAFAKISHPELIHKYIPPPEKN
jgi:hypothetical protein